MPYVKVANIEVPVDAERFCSPDMREVLEFYPKWKRLGGGWSIQGYFTEFCKHLEKWETDNGREYKDRGQRAIQHFGVQEFGRMLVELGGDNA